MTYSSGGLIQATDYNGFVSTNAANINGVWNTSYGQTAVSNVATSGTITATQWSTLNSTLNSIASHQGTSITSRTNPVAGNVISVLANLSTDITSVNTNKFNAGTLGTQYTGWTGTASRTASTGNGTGYWTIFFSDAVTFANATAASNFFNAGGLVKVQFNKSSTGSGGDTTWNSLATDVGTIYLSSTGASKSLGGSSYTGTTKTGGSGSPTVLATGTGFAQLTTGNTTIFKQFSGNNYIQINALFSGSTLTLYTDWYSNVGTGTVSGGTASSGVSLGTAPTTVVSYFPPETVNLTNVWGTPTVASTVSVNEGPNPITVPGAPTIGTATATGSTTATVSFTAPASDGGATITSYTAVSSPGSITGTLSQAGSGTISVSGLSPATSYTFVVYATNIIGNSANSAASNSITTQAASGASVYTTAGTFTWTAPAGVTSVAAVAVGAGGAGAGANFYQGSNSGKGGGGGGLGWRNCIGVTPSTGYTVVVGAGGTSGLTAGSPGGASYFINCSTVAGGGGTGGAVPGGCTPTGGGRSGQGGGNGGNGGWRVFGAYIDSNGSGGGGGAGGYTGGGGNAGNPSNSLVGQPGVGGSGGGASQPGQQKGGFGGGGVGLFGAGASGPGGCQATPPGGGSGGQGGGSNNNGQGGAAGLYGGGGAMGSQAYYGCCPAISQPGTSGGIGAVRIIWGASRQFPYCAS